MSGLPMSIASGEVWIFSADLDARAPRFAADWKLLAADEKARFERFKVEAPARRFVAARAFLRETLASFLSIAAGEIKFDYGPEGKPYLAVPESRPPLEINLSHSAALAVLAVSPGRVVGVDVEHVRDPVEIEALARRFFSPRERDRLLALPVEERRRSFFCCWTRKEAYLKARGGGLTIPLDSFDVSFEPGETPRLIADRRDAAAAVSWQIHPLAIDPLAEAALVVAASKDESLAIRIAPRASGN